MGLFDTLDPRLCSDLLLGNKFWLAVLNPTPIGRIEFSSVNRQEPVISSQHWGGVGGSVKWARGSMKKNQTNPQSQQWSFGSGLVTDVHTTAYLTQAGLVCVFAKFILPAARLFDEELRDRFSRQRFGGGVQVLRASLPSELQPWKVRIRHCGSRQGAE